MPKVTKNTNLTNRVLVSFKAGLQVAKINGSTYKFDLSENELAESIEANTSLHTLSQESGLHYDDYTAIEMAQVVASYWNEADVQLLIDAQPESELSEYLVTEKGELENAA